MCIRDSVRCGTEAEGGTVKLIDYFVRNAQLTIVLLIALLAAGVQAFLTIPRAEDPLIDFPGFSVVAVYPGAGPADVEQLVVNPIEKRLKELSDIKKIATQITDGLGVIQIEFTTGSIPRQKRDDVLREVNQLRSTLPAELALLDVLSNNTGNVNVLQYALVSPTAPYSALEAFSRALKDRIAAVPGVRKVERVGAPVREVQVSLDLGRLSALHLPLPAVLGALSSESANVPGGTVNVSRKQFVVKTSGSYTSLHQVRNTVVGGSGSAVVRLRDVATVQWGYADATHIARHDGERAVFVAASMQPMARSSARVGVRHWSSTTRMAFPSSRLFFTHRTMLERVWSWETPYTRTVRMTVHERLLFVTISSAASLLAP